MPFELKVIAEPGSATECGGCPLIKRGACGPFGEDLEPTGWMDCGAYGDYKRLPECVEAERRAKEGA